MDLVKLITALCEIIERQNAIILDQAMELAQHDALNRADQIAAMRQKYAEAVGAPLQEVTEA